MNSQDNELNFSFEDNSQDFDFDETSWSRKVDYSKLKKVIVEEVENYDFDESSWRTEIIK